jgi:hypothetical protein
VAQAARRALKQAEAAVAEAELAVDKLKAN